MKDELSRVTMKDLELFLEVARLGSIREVARSRAMEAAQLSRLLTRLEKRLGRRLFSRSSRGVALTPEGIEGCGAVEVAIRQLSLFKAPVVRKPKSKLAFSIKGLGAPPFLAQFVAAPICSRLYANERLSTAQIAEMPQDRLVLAGLRGHISVALHSGDLGWPKTWVSEKAGTIRWGLFANKKFFPKPKMSEQEIQRIPFVYPIYWSPEGLRDGNDGFPLGFNFRDRAIGVTSAIGAINAIREAPMVAFLPVLVARELRIDEIFELETEVILQENLVISFHSEALTRRSLSALLKEVASFIGDQGRAV